MQNVSLKIKCILLTFINTEPIINNMTWWLSGKICGLLSKRSEFESSLGNILLFFALK